MIREMDDLTVGFAAPDVIQWSHTKVRDNTPVLLANKGDRESPRNGFVEGRHARHVARIPIAVIEVAESWGYDMTQAGDVMRFLAKYPEYLTVQAVNTGRPANIRVN